MFAPEKKTKEIDFDIFSKDKKDYQTIKGINLNSPAIIDESSIEMNMVNAINPHIHSLVFTFVLIFTLQILLKDNSLSISMLNLLTIVAKFSFIGTAIKQSLSFWNKKDMMNQLVNGFTHLGMFYVFFGLGYFQDIILSAIDYFK